MLSSNQTRQRGFTLIELVVVIVIIGILAAFAIPRFANISSEARVSQLRALAGTLRSTSALVHGMALARNVGAAGTVPMEGVNINIVNSYAAATALGITAAINNLDVTTTYEPLEDTPVAGTITYRVRAAATPATCFVTYAQSPAGLSATVTLTPVMEAGC